MRLVPVLEMKFGSAPTRTRTSLAKRILSGHFPVTKSLEGLTEDIQQSGFLDAKVAFDAKLVTATDACKLGTRIFMTEYSKHTDYQDDDEVVRWGVGIRFVFTVEMMDMSIKVDTLVSLAAAAELKMARVGCNFNVIGIQGPGVLKLFPKTLDTLDIQGLPKIIKAIDSVRSIIYKEDIRIMPCILGESMGLQMGSYFLLSPDFTPITFALQCLMNGYCLQEAKKELINRKMPEDKLAVVDEVYNQIFQSSDSCKKPDSTTKEKARKQLFGE